MLQRIINNFNLTFLIEKQEHEPPDRIHGAQLTGHSKSTEQDGNEKS